MSVRHFNYQKVKNDLIGLHVIEKHGLTYVAPETIVGYCHCNTHTGYVEKDIMKKHDCLGKKCEFFEKFNDFPYWIAKQKEEQLKKERRLKKKIKTIMEADDARRLTGIVEDAVRHLQYPIVITRVAPVREKNNTYIINYVSDNAKNDWYEYKDLIAHVFGRHRACYVLKHTKRPDGKYATICDWQKIKKNAS